MSITNNSDDYNEIHVNIKFSQMMIYLMKC